MSFDLILEYQNTSTHARKILQKKAKPISSLVERVALLVWPDNMNRQGCLFYEVIIVLLERENLIK